MTQDPRTENPSRNVINASYGLGEAVVVGGVQPDEYTVGKETHQILQTIVGSKRIQILPNKDRSGTVLLATPSTRIVQLVMRTETKKIGVFSKQKSERIVKTIRELFCEEKCLCFSSNSIIQVNNSG